MHQPTKHQVRATDRLWPNLPGYGVVRVIGEGGSGRVFEVTAPGGFAKAVKLVAIESHNPLSERELQGLRLIRSIRHPYLVTIERLDVEPDRLTMVMELADGSLRDEFRQKLDAGLSGIPRRQLLNLMREAAEALDFLNLKYSIQHLDIKPENLFLIAGHMKVGDYGLVREAGRYAVDVQANAITPAYASPELFDGAISACCDQYSLAVVFMEMLTGQRPFRATNVRQLALHHLTRPPDVGALPPADRPVIAKALSRTPADRFTSCLEMVDALLANPAVEIEPVKRLDRPETAVAARAPAITVPVKFGGREKVDTVRAAADVTTSLEDLAKHVTASMTQLFVSPLDLKQVRESLSKLTLEWSAEWFDLGEQAIALRFETRSNWFRQMVGMRDSLLMVLRLFERQQQPEGTVVGATISYHGRKVADATFLQYARGAGDALREAIKATEASPQTIRMEERVPIHCPVTLVPLAGSMRNLQIPCTALNLSSHSLGMVSTLPVEPGEVRIRMMGANQTLRGRVVRCHRAAGEKCFTIGVRIAADSPPLNTLATTSP